MQRTKWSKHFKTSAVKHCETLKIDVLNVDDQESYAEEWLPSFIEGLK